MKVVFTKAFQKSIRKTKDKKLIQSISSIVNKVMEAEEMEQIPKLKKMTGYKTAFRIRCREDYRIGVFIENDIVEFAIFAHRKDIYKLFP